MIKHFCTYFDKNYLLKGLALHHSLLKTASDFCLWILCFDDITYSILDGLKLEKVKLIKLSDFEDQELLKVKGGRKVSEYCWTCTPSLPLYILNQKPEMETIAYLDADLYFFDSPQKIYDEFGDDSIMIIPHNFSEDQRWREKTSGTYNVGMLIFRNDPNGLECLKWWRERCLEWCFDCYEDGKLGDQMYLNDWPQRFKGVCVLKNQGANVASWNIKDYNPVKWPLIFYHFHGLKIYLSDKKIKSIPISVWHKKIYDSYIATLNHIYRDLLSKTSFGNYGLDPKPSILKILKQRVLRLFR